MVMVAIVIVSRAVLTLTSRFDVHDFWYLGQTHCGGGSAGSGWGDAWRASVLEGVAGQLEHLDGGLVFQLGWGHNHLFVIVIICRLHTDVTVLILFEIYLF